MKENITDGTLVGNFWNKRTLTFGNEFLNYQFLHEGQFFFFSFVLNVLVQGILPYAEVELGPSKLLSFILTESWFVDLRYNVSIRKMLGSENHLYFELEIMKLHCVVIIHVLKNKCLE